MLLNSRKYDPGFLFRIKDPGSGFFFRPGSRIQGSKLKKHRIPDPQHWKKTHTPSTCTFFFLLKENEYFVCGPETWSWPEPLTAFNGKADPEVCFMAIRRVFNWQIYCGRSKNILQHLGGLCSWLTWPAATVVLYSYVSVDALFCVETQVALQTVHFGGIRGVFCHMHVGNQTPETKKKRHLFHETK